MKEPSIKFVERVMCWLVAITLVTLLALLLTMPAAAWASRHPPAVSAENEDIRVTLFHKPCELGGVVDHVLREAPEVAPYLEGGELLIKESGRVFRLCYIVNGHTVHVVDEIGAQGRIPVEMFK